VQFPVLVRRRGHHIPQHLLQGGLGRQASG